MSSDLGKLSLMGVDFRIEEATLEGWLAASRPDSEVCWSLELRCERSDLPGHDLSDPRLYAESFRLPVTDWTALEGKSLSWSLDAPLRADSVPTLYAGSHFELPSSEIVIGRRDGDRFQVTWQGTADLMSQGEHAVPFSAEAVVTFTGITVTGAAGLDERVMADAVTGAPGLDERVMADALRRKFATENLSSAGARDAPDWPRRGWQGLLDKLFPGRRPRPNRIADFKPNLD